MIILIGKYGKCASEVVVDGGTNVPQGILCNFSHMEFGLGHFLWLANVKQAEAHALGFVLWLLGILRPAGGEVKASLLAGEWPLGEAVLPQQSLALSHSSYPLTTNGWGWLTPVEYPPT